LIVRDVCSACNNGSLSNLDGYGKTLYDRFFAKAVYGGEIVNFEYDGDQLIRWLLKVSYNSARVQKADASALREFRDVILGKSPLSDRVRCWLSLITATYIEPEVGFWSARPEQRGHPKVDEPLWFRVAQCRFLDVWTPDLVQRMVIINSFKFTLVAAPCLDEHTTNQLDLWGSEFAKRNPDARLISARKGCVTVTTGTDCSVSSFMPNVHHYPTRYGDEPNAQLASFIKGEKKALVLYIPRELIDEGDVSAIAGSLHDMVSNRERVTAFVQRVAVVTDGYDDDERELWEIPEPRAFFRRLFLECPFAMLLAHPEGGLLRLLFACWVFEPTAGETTGSERASDFLDRGFRGLNEVVHRLALSDELNREISLGIEKVLFPWEEGKGPRDATR
jgi:hypothetical protein